MYHFHVHHHYDNVWIIRWLQMSMDYICNFYSKKKPKSLVESLLFCLLKINKPMILYKQHLTGSMNWIQSNFSLSLTSTTIEMSKWYWRIDTCLQWFLIYYYYSSFECVFFPNNRKERKIWKSYISFNVHTHTHTFTINMLMMIKIDSFNFHLLFSYIAHEFFF